MNLAQVVEALDGQGELSVPDWLPGAYRRQFIHFEDGRTDSATQVFWLQSGGLTIDLRLPANPIAPDEPHERFQGWCAESVWRNDQLSWKSFVSFHDRDLWPEPAILNRVGLHMIERAPSGIYLEDWLALQSQTGPLAGFRLESIKLPGESDWRDCGGALIVAGDWAGWVFDGRLDKNHVAPLPAFVTRIGRGSLQKGFRISAALNAELTGQPLMPASEFEIFEASLLQRFIVETGEILLRYSIDWVQTDFAFGNSGKTAEQGQLWYQSAHDWLARR